MDYLKDYPLWKVNEGGWGSEPRVFKIMRIIWPTICHVEGIGTVWYFFDMKTGRQWARRYEEPK